MQVTTSKQQSTPYTPLLHMSVWVYIRQVVFGCVQPSNRTKKRYKYKIFKQRTVIQSTAKSKLGDNRYMDQKHIITIQNWYWSRSDGKWFPAHNHGIQTPHTQSICTQTWYLTNTSAKKGDQLHPQSVLISFPPHMALHNLSIWSPLFCACLASIIHEDTWTMSTDLLLI